MHTLLLVTLSMSASATSEDARMRAHSRLVNDDSFCGDGGRFGSPLCDWFVIGGRYSGKLQKTLLGQPFQDALLKEFPELTTGYVTSRFVEQRQAALDQLWHRFGGIGPHPFNRKDWEEFGSDDDAMPLDRRLYDHFLKDHAGFATNLPGLGVPCDFADLDDEPLEESFIGRKWLVAVDYHN